MEDLIGTTATLDRTTPGRDEVLRQLAVHARPESMRKAARLLAKGVTAEQARVACGTQAVVYNLKAVENVVAGRLVHTSNTAVRRTGRLAAVMHEAAPSEHFAALAEACDLLRTRPR